MQGDDIHCEDLSSSSGLVYPTACEWSKSEFDHVGHVYIGARSVSVLSASVGIVLAVVEDVKHLRSSILCNTCK